MRHFLIIVIILFYSIHCSAQTSDVGKIAISVIMPDNIEGLNVSNLSKLETKLIQMVTQTGLAATSYNNNFAIYPKLAIYESNVVESGMQDLTVYNCEISFFVKQIDNNMMYASVSKTLKGAGKDKQMAFANAIKKIDIGNKDYQSFLDVAKQKILAYYQLKCDDIIVGAVAYSKRQDYEQALGLLMSVPSEVPCYQKVQEKSISIYKDYQDSRCLAQLQKAKSLAASGENYEALSILGDIDPSTQCNSDVQSLIKILANRVSEDKRKEWDIRMKIYNDNVALEKERMNAVKEIAIAYYKSRPTTVTYTNLILY